MVENELNELVKKIQQDSIEKCISDVRALLTNYAKNRGYPVCFNLGKFVSDCSNYNMDFSIRRVSDEIKFRID